LATVAGAKTRTSWMASFSMSAGEVAAGTGQGEGESGQ